MKRNTILDKENIKNNNSLKKSISLWKNTHPILSSVEGRRL